MHSVRHAFLTPAFSGTIRHTFREHTDCPQNTPVSAALCSGSQPVKRHHGMAGAQQKAFASRAGGLRIHLDELSDGPLSSRKAGIGKSDGCDGQDR